MTSTYHQLRRLMIEQFDVPGENLRPETTFTDLGIDSISLLEMAVILEDEFEVRLEADPSLTQTLADVAELVDKQIGHRAPGGPR